MCMAEIENGGILLCPSNFETETHTSRQRAKVHPTEDGQRTFSRESSMKRSYRYTMLYFLNDFHHCCLASFVLMTSLRRAHAEPISTGYSVSAFFAFVDSHHVNSGSFFRSSRWKPSPRASLSELATCWSSNSRQPDCPHVALITEPDACDTLHRSQETSRAISRAISTGLVSLVSVRTIRPETVSLDEYESRVVDLTSRLVALASNSSATAGRDVRVVVASDWVAAAVHANAHGIHVKERDRFRIPDIRRQLSSHGRPAIIGTSAHSVSSALEALKYDPDYLFVGTCYTTESHPGKEDLEGPQLPGNVQRAFQELLDSQPPVVFAIGGIDETNCNEPVGYGADGVAMIRAVLQSSDPAQMVETMVCNMQQSQK